MKECNGRDQWTRIFQRLFLMNLLNPEWSWVNRECEKERCNEKNVHVWGAKGKNELAPWIKLRESEEIFVKMYCNAECQIGTKHMICSCNLIKLKNKQTMRYSVTIKRSFSCIGGLVPSPTLFDPCFFLLFILRNSCFSSFISPMPHLLN